MAEVLCSAAGIASVKEGVTPKPNALCSQVSSLALHYVRSVQLLPSAEFPSYSDSSSFALCSVKLCDIRPRGQYYSSHRSQLDAQSIDVES